MNASLKLGVVLVKVSGGELGVNSVGFGVLLGPVTSVEGRWVYC